MTMTMTMMMAMAMAIAMAMTTTTTTTMTVISVAAGRAQSRLHKMKAQIPCTVRPLLVSRQDTTYCGAPGTVCTPQLRRLQHHHQWRSFQLRRCDGASPAHHCVWRNKRKLKPLGCHCLPRIGQLRSYSHIQLLINAPAQPLCSTRWTKT